MIPLLESATAVNFARTAMPCSLHELAPYIGKMRPELATWAVNKISRENEVVFDPYCGSGTVLLEATLNGREAVGTDLNPYAYLISKGKLDGLKIKSARSLHLKIQKLAPLIPDESAKINLADVPAWVQEFYHPRTLVELMAWCNVLRAAKDFYLYSCLLAIAHHQRPGFLSFPASHTVPYLRTGNFPRRQFAEMYEYREVLPRLIKKALRSFRRIDAGRVQSRPVVKLADAARFRPPKLVDAILTSPPYMGQLHYGRDNRLRLWLMGYVSWETLDTEVSPFAKAFQAKMIVTFDHWARILKPQGVLAVLVGDTSNSSRSRLDTLVTKIAAESNGAFELAEVVKSDIPRSRRTRKGCNGSNAELLLILKKGKRSKT